MAANDHGNVRQPPWKRLECVALALILIVTGFVYFPVLGYGYTDIDDSEAIFQNRENLEPGPNWPNVRWAFTTFHFANWMPVTWLSYQIDAAIHTIDRPWGFHTTNLLIHLATVLILYLWLREATGQPGPSLFVTALFALHPLHSESVVWISERKGLLSTGFGMLTILCYVRAVQRPSRFWYLASLLAYALSLGSKQMLVTMPGILLLLDFWPLRRWNGMVRWRVSTGGLSFPRLLLEKTPFILLAGALAVVAFAAQYTIGALPSFDMMPVKVRIQNAVVSAAFYLTQFVWPNQLTFHYRYLEIAVPTLLWSSGILAAGCLVALYYSRRVPAVMMGWCWYLWTLLPIIGLVQISGHARAVRYSDIPILGIAIGVTWAAKALFAPLNGRVVLAMALVVLACFAARTRVEVGYWETDEKLARRSLELDPYNDFGLHLLGSSYMHDGQFERAAEIYREMVEIYPDHQHAGPNCLYAMALAAGEREPIHKPIPGRPPTIPWSTEPPKPPSAAPEDGTQPLK